MKSPKRVNKGQKMMNHLTESDMEAEKVQATKEQCLTVARYEFLLSEQPILHPLRAQRFMTSVTGGCVATLFPVYWDFKEPFQDVAALGVVVLGFFTIGLILTHAIGRILTDMSNKTAMVNNIELLEKWTRPIIIMPYDRLDTSVDARVKEITDILANEKCVNHLHIALENVEMSTEYGIEYGFRKGEVCQTNTGLPVVGLFPELFVLRGAFDDTLWYEFQKEAVRIALEIDNEFAKCWFALETEKYRIVAGGQQTA